MLTARGGWFLAIVVLMFVLGAFVIPFYSVVPAILAITLLAWFAFEWAVFQTRSNAAVSRLRVTRHVLQGGREVPMLWAGIGFEVRVTVENPGAVRIPFAVLEDRAAVATERVAGSPQLFAELLPRDSVEIAYTLKSPSPGVLRFEGVRVRVADVHGFFYRRVFLRDAVEFLVLPPLTDDEGRQRADEAVQHAPAAGHSPTTPTRVGERTARPPRLPAWRPAEDDRVEAVGPARPTHHQGVRERRAGAVRPVPRHVRRSAARPAWQHATHANGRSRCRRLPGIGRQPRPRRADHIRRGRSEGDVAGADARFT